MLILWTCSFVFNDYQLKIGYKESSQKNKKEEEDVYVYTSELVFFMLTALFYSFHMRNAKWMINFFFNYIYFLFAVFL